VAAAVATRVSRRSQATAAAIRVAREIEGRERSASGAGLGRLTDPDLSRVGLAVPEWAGWASWPVGPSRLWSFVLKQIPNSNLNIIFFLNLIQNQNSNNINKTISYSLMK
jgi:hypothetical protein